MSGVVIRFPVYAARAIVLERSRSGRWLARFEGDAWTAPFCTEEGDRYLVLRDVMSLDVRRGLPIEDSQAPRFDYPKSHSPRLAVDPFAPDWSGGNAV